MPIPEQRVDVVAVDMADDEDLQIVQVHVEYLRPADPQCLQHAVRRCGAVARGQGQQDYTCKHLIYLHLTECLQAVSHDVPHNGGKRLRASTFR